MSQFVFLYRLPPMPPPSPQQMQDRMQRWMAWMKGIEQKEQLVTAGHPLASGGAVVTDDRGSVSDGPFAETKDIVMGFSIVEAKDLEEAIALTAGCPILQGAGRVEVRPIAKI